MAAPVTQISNREWFSFLLPLSLSPCSTKAVLLFGIEKTTDRYRPWAPRIQIEDVGESGLNHPRDNINGTLL